MTTAPINALNLGDQLIKPKSFKAGDSSSSGVDFAAVLGNVTEKPKAEARPTEKPVAEAKPAADVKVGDKPAADDSNTKADNKDSKGTGQTEGSTEPKAEETVAPPVDADGVPVVPTTVAVPVVVLDPNAVALAAAAVVAADATETSPAPVAATTPIAAAAPVAALPQPTPAASTGVVDSSAGTDAGAGTDTGTGAGTGTVVPAAGDPTATTGDNTAVAPQPATTAAPTPNLAPTAGANTAELLAALSPVLDHATAGKADAAVTALATTDPKAAAAATDAATAKAALDAMSSSIRATDASQSAPAATRLVSTAMQTEPYRQVVNVVAPLKHLSDGDYSMTLKLHPAHLGSVEITVALQGGQVNLSMNSDNAASRQMLKDSMNELRASLEQSGLSAGSMDVGSNAQQQGSSSTGNSGSARNNAYRDEVEDVSALARFDVQVPAAPVTDGRLDARV